MTSLCKTLATAAAAACLQLPLWASAAPLTLDDFDGRFDSHTVIFANYPTPVYIPSKTVAAAVPGGTRALDLRVADPLPIGSNSAALSGSGDLWAFGTVAQRLDFVLSYGTRSAMNLDLGGFDRLRFDVYLSTPLRVTVEAATDTMPGDPMRLSSFSFDMPELFKDLVDIPLASFGALGSGGGVDWSNVDSLRFSIAARGPILPTPAGDAFWIHRITAMSVPEPGSGALATTALVLALALRRLRRTAGAGAAVLAVTGAAASPVYEQFPVAGDNVGVAWTSQLASDGGYRSFDDFTLGAATTIGRATWRGVFLEDGGSNGAGLTERWTLSFWSDAAGPSTPLFERTLLASEVRKSLVAGPHFFGSNPVDLFDFEADLGPIGFTAAPLRRYWFSAVAGAGGFRPAFTWTMAGDKGTTHQQQVDGDGRVQAEFSGLFGDRAFALYAVPEPSSLALVGLAMLLATGAPASRQGRSRAAA